MKQLLRCCFWMGILFSGVLLAADNDGQNSTSASVRGFRITTETDELNRGEESIQAMVGEAALDQKKRFIDQVLGLNIKKTMANEASASYFNFFSKESRSLNDYTSAIYNALIYRMPVLAVHLAVNVLGQLVSSEKRVGALRTVLGPLVSSEEKMIALDAFLMPVAFAITGTALDIGYVYWPENWYVLESDESIVFATCATLTAGLGGVVAPAVGGCPCYYSCDEKFSVARFLGGLGGSTSNFFFTALSLLNTPVVTDILKNEPSALIRTMNAVGGWKRTIRLFAAEDTTSPILKWMADHKRNETAIYKVYKPEDNPCLTNRDRKNPETKEECEFADRVEGLYQTHTVIEPGGIRVELLIAEGYGLEFEKVDVPEKLTRDVIVKAFEQSNALLEASRMVKGYKITGDLKEDKFQCLVVTTSEDRKTVHISLQTLAEKDENGWLGFFTYKVINLFGAFTSHSITSFSLPAGADVGDIADEFLKLFEDSDSHVVLFKVRQFAAPDEGEGLLEHERIEL